MKKNLLALPLLILVSLLCPQPIFPNFPTTDFAFSKIFYAQSFWRTELYFGRDKNDGTEVSEEDWSRFLDEIVTPRFPDGLTVLDGNGQYRFENGKIVKEKSKVLILLYTPQTRLLNSRKIDQIRNEYKKMFKQESVMRIDFRQMVKVTF